MTPSPAMNSASIGMDAMGCPVIDHLACKLPGELEPRIYDVYFTTVALAAGAFLPQQFVSIGNRDAPWHLAGIGWKELATGGQLKVQLYNSRGFGMSDLRIRAGNLFGGANAILPVNPSYVWPVNSSLCFDLENVGAGSGTYGLFFYGFKIFDRGKAPC
jgi:hypothetical protein